MAAIPSFVASTTVAGSAVTSINLIAPATLYDGDILLAMIYTVVPAITVSAAAAGFTQLTTYTSSDSRTTLYWKRASSESGTYQFDAAGATWMGGYMATYRGAISRGNPWNATGTGATGTGTSATATAITTTAVGSRLIFVAVDAAGTAMTPPAGMTERIDTPGYYLADGENYATGTTGSKTATLASDIWSCVLLALSPGGPSFVEASRRPAPFKPGLAR